MKGKDSLTWSTTVGSARNPFFAFCIEKEKGGRGGLCELFENLGAKTDST
jgi:hypothetical protein